MKVKSLDMATKISIGSDVEKEFEKLLSEFLAELSPRIDTIPVTIHISVESGYDWWNFVADIKTKPGKHFIPHW